MKNKNNDISLWVYISYFLMMFIRTPFLVTDTDLMFQVQLGEWETHGNFYNARNLVWGSKDVNEYLDHEWLYSCISYLLHQLPCGVFIHRILISIILGLTFIWFCKSIIRIFDIKTTNTKYILSLCLVFIYCGWCVSLKAYMYSVVCLMFEIILLYDYYKENISFKKALIYSLLLVIVWNNIHSSSVLLYFGVAGLFWLCNGKSLRMLLIGLFDFLALIINPYGLRLFLFDISHIGTVSMYQIIDEWKSIDSKGIMGATLVLCVLFLLYSIYISKVKDKFILFLIFTVLFMVTMSVRHIIYLLPLIPLCIYNCDEYKIKLDIIAECLSILSIGLLLMNIYNCIAHLNYSDLNTLCKFEFDDELETILLDNDSQGLFNACEYDVNYLGLKSFTTGANPLHPNRSYVTYMMQFYFSDSLIAYYIDYYDLTKFIICKDNIYGSKFKKNKNGSPNNVYCYLVSHPEKYECLYDKNNICYFKERI